jgi:hypothetical protein
MEGKSACADIYEHNIHADLSKMTLRQLVKKCLCCTCF